MPQLTIAVLHTSFVFVNVEPMINDLLAELLPEAKILHFVDSDMLDTVVREGGISAATTQRMVYLAKAAETAGADVIFSACSSLGPTLDAVAENVRVPVVKIDDAMAEQAAASADRIGVLSTVPTTLGPTSNLIAQHAQAMSKGVTITPSLTDGAFDVLMSGDRDRHDAMVVAQAQRLAREVDLIVLAQASMARLADRIAAETGRPVLISPRLGVGQLAEIARSITA